MKKYGTDKIEGVIKLFEKATGRKPGSHEKQILSAAYKEQVQYFKKNKAEMKKLAGKDATPEKAAGVILSSMILNLSETITRN